MTSPTQHSLKLMRDRGYPLVQVVEKYIPQARKRIDLFGCWDILCVSVLGQVVAVQTTSKGNVRSRINKIIEADSTPLLRKAGWELLVHGWHKRNGRWLVREVDVS